MLQDFKLTNFEGHPEIQLKIVAFIARDADTKDAILVIKNDDKMAILKSKTALDSTKSMAD